MEGRTANLDLRRFAACNQLSELEKYCRKEEGVQQQLKDVIKNPDKGIHYMIQDWQVPTKMVSQIVSDIFSDIGSLYEPGTPTGSESESRRLCESESESEDSFSGLFG
jgi:hypothetical protein